ncbi:hypothetical protein D0962_17775 [Leptolyngbyaceae cyanobacterium CCMR0082]|uniref:Uncharacterized protein n=1 Tax=Adonisia turfae CCMR0082 TaxID=2304604 RepID=A0A6M0S808_9CYAN|nr:hypothetical protein [Adonisia turfae]NEZ64614.1 hypothetical protein [Adonisia turfae CCMR0082]
MSDDFTVALRFSPEGTPQTIGDIRAIEKAIRATREETKRLSEQARILSEAYDLTAQEAAQVQQAMAAAARETERASRTAAEEAQRAREQFEATAAVVSTGLAVGVGAFFSQAIEQFRQFEQFESILTNALGSPEAAEEALAVIEQFAATTPFQLDEVVSSFIKLQNRGISPTTEQLRQLGDVAASQGKSLDQITEAILDAQTGEFERLKEFGIQASTSGDQVTIAFRDANLEVARTPEAISEAIFSLGDLEGVAGGMAAQSVTLTGRLSNLGDEASKASVAFGEFANVGVRPVVDAAILLVRSFNALPGPIQAILIASTALTGVLAAAVAITVAYNSALSQRVIKEALSAANTIRNTAATTAQGAALQVAAAAQATYATLTGQATAAQIAQTRALAAGTVTLAAIAGAIGSIALVADTIRSVDAEASSLRDTSDELRNSFESIRGTEPMAGVNEDIQRASEDLNIFQRTLDNLIRGPIPGLATAAEASANRTSIAFNDVVAATDDVRLAAAQTANALEDGIAIDPDEVQRTVASIDDAITALQGLEQTTPEATERIEAQITALTEYRERIVATDEGVTSLADSTGDLKNRLDSLNDSLSSGQLAIQQAGTSALAALEEQRVAGAVSAEDYQAQLANIERAGFNDRINLAQEKLVELRQLESATEDPEVLEQIQAEILKTQTTIDKDRIASARSRVKEIERLEQAEQKAAEEAAKKKRDAAIAAAKEETDALKKEREAQERIATEAFNTQQRTQTQTFDSTQQAAEERFNDQQRTEDRRFQEQLQADQSSFDDGQRAQQQAFDDRQRSQQETFNQRQRDAEQAFQDSLNEERRQGNAEFDALEREVENRIALSEASTRAERQAIQDRIDAEEEAADIRRDVESDVLRQRNSIVDDEDTELSPLEQARADFEAELQAKEQEFQEQQQSETQAFENAQQASKQEFEDSQRLAAAGFEEEQRNLKLQFEDQQRQAEAEFQEGQRALEQQFEDQQRQAEATFKAGQRSLDEASANRIKGILESARNTGVQARREGGPVRSGQPYLVGEDGPELIFPSRAGFVATAGQTARLLSRVGSLTGKVAAAPSADTTGIERKLDQLIKIASKKQKLPASATINMAPGATEIDALKLSMDYQRESFKRSGFL